MFSISTWACIELAGFEVLVLFLRIYVVCDMTLCNWVSKKYIAFKM